jgi:hypothetical protein
MIPGIFTKIPYAREQGIFSAEQGIKVPCSAENRDISALGSPPHRRFPRGSAAGRKEGGAMTPCDLVVHA